MPLIELVSLETGEKIRRQAIERTVEGRALLGPTRFPAPALPRLNMGECAYQRDGVWIIEGAKPKRKREENAKP